MATTKHRMCLECGEREAMADSDNCGQCDGVQCAWCGMTDDDSLQLHQGDRVCFHCANGHQRVKYRVVNDVYGCHVVGAAVHGPCNCEVA